MRGWIVLLIVAVVFLSGGALRAEAGRAYCPRVTSEHNADTTDLKRFREFHAWKDKTGNDLAIAVWQYLCDNETGLYHFNEVHDGPDPFGEYSTMRNPLKMLNVYNMGYCGIFGPTVEGIFNGIGFETGRSFGLAAWSHCATEIYYDKAWHYFDVDVRGILVKPDGTVASLAEARTDKQLWIDSIGRIKPFFPHHATPEKAARVYAIYAKSDLDYQYRWWQGGHTADWSLRPGESFTRWWQPQGGRWNHLPMYNTIDWTRKLLETPPRGMKPNHRDWTPWNHGNGLFHYAPKLTADSEDFATGVRSASGFVPGKDGLTVEKGAKAAEAVFEVFTPFIIVAKINDLDNLDDDVEASVVTLDATMPVKASVSTDNGMTWAEAGTIAPGGKPLDLTKQVKGQYGYLLKLSAGEASGEPLVRSLSIDTWVQVAPISLPRLKEGVNRCNYATGDRHGGLTTPMLVLPNVADPDDLKKYVTEMPKRYTPKENLGRVAGEMIVKLEAPIGQKIVWFSAGGTFTTHQQEAAKNTANSMAYAIGERLSPVAERRQERMLGEWKEFYKADAPTWAGHWRYNWDEDVRLDKPAETVFVRYIGNPAVNVVRACLHLTPPTAEDRAVKITHGVKLDGKDVEKVVEMKAGGDYQVECKGKVENVFIRIEKPSI